MYQKSNRADKFLKSSISDTINKITIEVRKIDHCLSKNLAKKTPNREKMNKGTRTIPLLLALKFCGYFFLKGNQQVTFFKNGISFFIK